MNSHQRKVQRRRFSYPVPMVWERWTAYPWHLHEWCIKTFGRTKFRVDYRYPVTYWFDSERNAILFTMRWVGND